MSPRNDHILVRHFKWLIYIILGLCADALDVILTFWTNPARHTADFSEVENLTDDEILKLAYRDEQLDPFFNVRWVTPNTVLKTTGDPYVGSETDHPIPDSLEANALNLVFTHTTIPVPRVHRVIEKDDFTYILMEYIHGQTLAAIWTSISIWKKLWIILTLRRYIRQLQHLKASPTTPPGAISPRGPRRSYSPVLSWRTKARGPFPTITHLATQLNKLHLYQHPEGHPLRSDLFDQSEELVLCHQDLNLWNIILETDNTLWIIDWAWAGYYPPWFEYVAMENQNRGDDDSEDLLWRAAIPFICHPYFKQAKWWGGVADLLI
ncbi:hypothetical protein H0H87_011303 [Tephrocybe sp. NHM501043]|nr:hypothetical protein H0H87_011303 [Tephrocybe sp. NHM501043]